MVILWPLEPKCFLSLLVHPNERNIKDFLLIDKLIYVHAINLTQYLALSEISLKNIFLPSLTEMT